MLNVMTREDETTPIPPHWDDDTERWAAVERRDPAADGQFVYSVKTTGVYCRPSCPSRLARRENVAFHTNPAAAEAAGFRPCKRCRPTEPTLEERRAELVAAACRQIEAAGEPPSLGDLAEAAGVSRFHFHRIFKETTGVTPKAYAAEHRARRVRGGLERGAKVTDALYDAGYNASSRFYEESNERLGMRPTEYREGGTGVEIKFAIGECSLGSILVAATDKGVCAITLADDPEILVRDLQDRFPKADLRGAETEFERVVAAVVGLVEEPRGSLGLPLDVRGTAFQQKVWVALREIPAGTTASYAEIARTIGKPKAVRAVAGACAANHLAVAIPCHRVVRKDGSLSGYRWGVERKRELLEREVSASSD